MGTDYGVVFEAFASSVFYIATAADLSATRRMAYFVVSYIAGLVGSKLSALTGYLSWSSMHSRCSNVKDPYYDKYGGHGIAVCEPWTKFEIFLSDMGERFPGHTLDRIDVNKEYSPGNCRWATPKTQSRNKRNNHLIDTPSGSVCIIQTSEIYGIKVQTLRLRLNDGWGIEQVLLTKPWQKPI